jgi:integrase
VVFFVLLWPASGARTEKRIPGPALLRKDTSTIPCKRKLPPGLRLRNGEYHSDFYANGRRVRKRLSGDLDAATTILNDLKARADKGDFGLLDNDYPLKAMREQYLRHCRQALKPATVDRYEDGLVNILPRLAAANVAQVTVGAVLACHQERLGEEVSPRTVNIDVGSLGGMLRWAVGAGLIGSNPLAGLKPLLHDEPKEGRALYDDEVRRLLDHSDQPWRDVWYAFLVTSVRKGELAALTFRDVDWEGRELVVRAGVAKNHRERRVPIEAGLWDILLKQKAGRDRRQPGGDMKGTIAESLLRRFTRENVFVTNANTPLDHRSTMYHAFIRCCERAGVQTRTLDAEGDLIEHVDVHSLRRTFATNLIAGGADPKSVQELLGHRTLDMTMRIYAKAHPQTKRQALGRLTYGAGATTPAHVAGQVG